MRLRWNTIHSRNKRAHTRFRVYVFMLHDEHRRKNHFPFIHIFQWMVWACEPACVSVWMCASASMDVQEGTSTHTIQKYAVQCAEPYEPRDCMLVWTNSGHNYIENISNPEYCDGHTIDCMHTVLVHWNSSSKSRTKHAKRHNIEKTLTTVNVCWLVGSRMGKWNEWKKKRALKHNIHTIRMSFNRIITARAKCLFVFVLDYNFQIEIQAVAV